MNFPSKSVENAYQKTLEALKNSYCPYSNFRVAACIKIQGEETFITGVNVENASFGASICAERSAIVSFISQHGSNKKIEFLLLCTSPATFPCSICRQVLSEFLSPETLIYITSPEKKTHSDLTAKRTSSL